MPKRRYPHLSHETTRHGKKVWYFKKDGKRIRLPDSYGSQEFLEAYKNALVGDRTEKRKAGVLKQGTLAWLIEEYRKSSAYKVLRPTTKNSRNSVYNKIITESGTIPFARITKKHIQDAVDRRAEKPSVVMSFLSAVSTLFVWALSNGLATQNPVTGVSRIPFKSDGHHAWTIEEVEQYRSHHPIGSMPRLALELMLFFGLRRSDVIHVGPQHIKDGVLSFKTQKTGAWVYIPVFKQLQKCIDATEKTGEVFILSNKGKAFSNPESFGMWFLKKCREAKLPAHCTAHGLRKAGATIAANAGASTQELMAMFGWSKIAMAETYTKEADKTRLAYQAAKKLSKEI
ncbi:Integrase / recombinase [Liberibacter crescens BT-1]|uniref:Integrase / recombinase n=1 Tax=Liberibacter crescens (strain BT-1) TaxID=1215343 RepID=L0EUX2_LIBCB|nr:tyrosine-type recombinase/integrase [Liberibacter crescens]AGA64458.1 Integrase / recombinase [Liberibacter crescens BT-1]AMC12631.1 integrase [Liberibacter crescens]